MDISVGALAARAIYTLCEPKPKSSFLIHAFAQDHMWGGIAGKGLMDPNWRNGHYELILLSDGQRQEIRGWISGASTRQAD